MIRVLVIIAVAGFVVSLGCLMGAAAIAGPDALAGKGWDWAGGHPWRFVMNHDDERSRGPTVTRSFTWDGSEQLSVRTPAKVRYVQRAGPPTLTITGASDVLDRMSVDGGEIRLRGPHWRHGELVIDLSAPNVHLFNISGAGELRIEGYDQDKIFLDISGVGEVIATGKTRAIELDISGAGDADLGGMQAREADVEISGAGDATVAPTDRARLRISGMGDINLLTNPAQVATDISGLGEVHRKSPAQAAPSPAGENAAPGNTT